MAVMERQQQFDFQKNGIEVMNFETLQRTYKENDIYNNPVQGIYHYQVIRRMMDICEKYNLDYEVEEIFAAQNRNKTQPGVSILPQVEQTHGEKAVEAHILRRIFATIRIRDWETDELTTTLVVAYHQDGIQAAIGPCVKICHILSEDGKPIHTRRCHGAYSCPVGENRGYARVQGIRAHF